MDTLDLNSIATELEKLRRQHAELAEDERMDADSMARLIELQAFAESFRSDTGYDLEDMAREESFAVASYDFRDYAEELAEELGYTSDDNNPLLSYVDWDAWARDLKYDYVSFTYNGIEYLVRSY